jgi:FkbM family methyltransferase
MRQVAVDLIDVAFSMNNRDVAFSIYQNLRWLYPAAPCYEPDVAHVMTKFIRPGDHVIDGGANWGYHSLLMSRLVGESGIVWAIEPDRYNVQMLHKNLALNNTTNVLLCESPLWDKIEEKEFSCLDNSGSSGIGHYDCEGAIFINKTTTTLDDIIPKDIPIRLIKLDCEGAEQHILKGSSRLLARGVDAIVVELNFMSMPSFGWTTQTLRRYMESFGYDFFLLNLNGFFPTYVPPQVDFNFDACILNVLFAPMLTVARDWGLININVLGPIFLGGYIVKDGMVSMVHGVP